jgi:ParB-like chromosome segregation protein Spo0J
VQIEILDMPIAEQLVQDCAALFSALDELDLDTKVDTLNRIREALLAHSPFKAEPVDCVRWIKSDQVNANDYNPNSVAPPEMKLLEHSITEDGYTQPIVSWQRDGVFEVVDGFHRHRVGKESATVRERVHGYLPAVVINGERQDKGDRMAATIRHNRARGEHRVESMAEIVVELKRRFWSDAKIATELGMDPDEVLRLTQVTGLAGLFADRAFSEAWQATSFDEVEGVDSDDE